MTGTVQPTLTTRQAEAIALRERGLKWREVGALLGVSLQAAQDAWRRGRAKAEAHQGR